MKLKKPDPQTMVLCISVLIFFLVAVVQQDALHTAGDFVPVYTGARCLLQGCNPYEPSQLQQQYFEAGGSAKELQRWDHEVPLYPPSTFLALSPLVVLPFPVVRVLWFLLNGYLFITSAWLILSLCPHSHRWLATVLVSLVLATSGILLALGNPAIFAISLLVIGSYFLLHGRFLLPGALMLMFSLAVKPQIGGLIVLYMIARGMHRRYAVAAAAGALAILLSACLILSLHPHSADWASTLRSNISTTVAAGGVNDPRPTVAKEHAIALINLQAITSVFSPDAREYNTAAYAIFLALLALLITVVLRTRANPETHLLSIGALAVLSLMPVYHRFYDTRMLIITIPAVVIVYRKRWLLGACIGALTVLAVVSVQFRVQKFLINHALWQSIMQHKFLFILLLRQQNLELPIIFCLYMAAMFTIRFPGAEETVFPTQRAQAAHPV